MVSLLLFLVCFHMQVKNPGQKEFPGGSVVKTASFHCRGAWIQSLLGVLRSLMLHGMARSKQKTPQTALIRGHEAGWSVPTPLYWRLLQGWRWLRVWFVTDGSFSAGSPATVCSALACLGASWLSLRTAQHVKIVPPLAVWVISFGLMPRAGIVGSQAGTEVPAFLCVFLDRLAEKLFTPSFRWLNKSSVSASSTQVNLVLLWGGYRLSLRETLKTLLGVN